MNGFSMIPKRDHREAQRAVDAFNAAHPVGTEVWAYVTSRECEVRTTTRSAAHLVGDVPAILVDGFKFPRPLSSVRKAESEVAS